MRISDWSSYVCSSDLRRPASSLSHARLNGWEAASATAKASGSSVIELCPTPSAATPVARNCLRFIPGAAILADRAALLDPSRSEEHTSELQSLMRISYAVFSLKKKTHRATRKHRNCTYQRPIALKRSEYEEKSKKRMTEN